MGLCLALAGCSWSIESLSSSRIAAASPTTAPSPGCTPAGVLAQVRQLLAGDDFEAHYLTIGDKLTLSVWLVDPAIDPATPASGMAAADREALARGLSISFEVVDRISCTQRMFDQVNPMIVDPRFQHWYKDFLPVRAFVGLHDPSTDDLIGALRAGGTAVEEARTHVPEAASTAPPGTCDWPEARAAIHADLGTEDNTAAYLIVGAGLVTLDGSTGPPSEDVGVEVQWPGRAAGDASDPVVRERLGQIAADLTCLWPAVSSLEAFVVDPSGRTLVYAVVPGNVIESETTPLPAGGVRINHLASWTAP